MTFLALLYVTLLLGPPVGDVPVRYRSLVPHGRLSTFTVLPGETVTLEGAARSNAGRLVPLADGRFEWTAPSIPGFYPIQVMDPNQRDSVTLQVFVLVPYAQLRGEYVNRYRIGRYPAQALRGLAIYAPPVGFVEVTAANQDVLVSPHFRLKQFLCKQAGGYPKYVVLDERLLQKLEYLLDHANAAGYRASTFHVMSGYRTPAYNLSLGNVPYSRHTWGAAADIFIDEDGDGRMDDLNRDGISDVRDAEVLFSVFESATNAPALQGLIGGMGKYRPTRAHGPFVHVDVRDRKARW